MENTIANNDLIEVITELTVSDIKTLNNIIESCLDKDIFASESVEIVKELHIKLLNLAKSLDKQV